MGLGVQVDSRSEWKSEMAARNLVPADECEVTPWEPKQLTEAQIEDAYRNLKREKVVAMREAREKAEQERAPSGDEEGGMFAGKPG